MHTPWPSLEELEPLFTVFALQRNRVAEDTCFLCAKSIPPGSRTDEHIIPLWAQEDCILRDQLITFRNGTTMPYRTAKVPCCATCNNEYLSKLETYMSKRIRQGKSGINDITESAWYLWIGKIRLALAYKDCLIALDRTNSSSPRMSEPDELDNISIIRHALQFIRFQKNAWLQMGPPPDSVIVLNCQETTEAETRWDLMNLLHPFITAVRIREAGCIVVFRDETVVASAMHNKLIATRFLSLHPMQFKEATARANWIAIHQHSHSTYETTAGVGAFAVRIIQAWTNNPSELFHPLEPDLYPQILHRMQEIENPQAPNGQIHSILHYDDTNEFYHISWDQVKAASLGDLFAGRFWIDEQNPPDTPHFNPEHWQQLD
tara:strand:+ start:358 stop:1485 length:1128 start_codon:yes stop_codon:yes gene_type:complete